MSAESLMRLLTLVQKEKSGPAQTFIDHVLRNTWVVVAIMNVSNVTVDNDFLDVASA